MSNTLYAFDRSMRSFDVDGRLHVEQVNISKATVNPYRGDEIPDWKRLGLVADKVYNLLRHPDELAAAAASFNNLPLLSEHIPVTADEHHPRIVVGSTGSDVVFEDDYLKSSIVVWVRDSIDRIEDGSQKELSSAYRYRADMTPGVWRGLHYDGVMRDIVGNHVALVDEGRAGPDVVVADRKPEMLKSRKAILLHGALIAHVAPKLAMDAKVDLTPALKGVTAGNLKGKVKSIAEDVVRLVSPQLAQDEGIDVDDVCKVIAAVRGEHDEYEDEVKEAVEEIVEDEDLDDEVAGDEDSPREDVIADLMDYLRDRLPREEYEHAASLVRREATMDEAPEDDDKPAMDAATVRSMIAAAEARGAKRQAQIEQAREDVKPLVGRLIGMDSAAEIYRTALKAKGYKLADLAGAKINTLKAMCAREVSNAKPSRVAMDHAKATSAREDFNKRYGVK